MQGNASSRPTLEQALDIAWGLWRELGVSSWIESPHAEVIDLEPLILFTAWLGANDSRLWEETVDWCVTNHRFVSSTRLRWLLRSADPDQAAQFREYAATVHASVPKLNWPSGGQARRVQLSRKSAIPQLDRKALLQLRLRAVFGVAARSEALRILLIDRPGGWSAAEIAQQAGYTKVNVAVGLDLLALAGAVNVQPVGNQYRYSIARPDQLAAFIGPVPFFQPDWGARFAVISWMVRSEQSPTVADPTARAAQRIGMLRHCQTDLERLGVARFVPRPGADDYADRFDAWARSLLRYFAGNQGPSQPDETVYEVRRHENGWEASIRKPGESDRPLTWRESDGELPRAHDLAPIDITGAPRLAHELLSCAFRRTDSAPSSARIQPDVLAFAEEELRAIPPGGSRTFGEAYLRFWSAERVARLGMRWTR